MINKILKLAGCIVMCELVGMIGAIFTVKAVTGWYMTLYKPSFTPPSWIFGPVWSLLYMMMGFALFIVWESPAKFKGAAYAFFFIQLALNLLWSIIFFGTHSITGGLINIAALWLMILMTLAAFSQISSIAAWLLVPYILWVSYAAALNAAILRLN